MCGVFSESGMLFSYFGGVVGRCEGGDGRMRANGGLGSSSFRIDVDFELYG